MASRRMFSLEIIDSDNFLDLSDGAQNLYFHLAMRADDDGFVNNPKKIQRVIGARDDDIKLLLAKKYIFTFESGIVVIKHWRLHNYLRKDRYKSSSNIDESELIRVKANGEYTLDTNAGIPLVDKQLTQVSIGKVSKDKKKNTDPASKILVDIQSLKKLADKYSQEELKKIKIESLKLHELTVDYIYNNSLSQVIALSETNEQYLLKEILKENK